MDFASIRAFFTPTVLFLLLNLIIGTIAVVSNLYSHRHRSPSADHRIHHQDAAGGGVGAVGGTIARSSSSNVLELVRSIGLFRFRSGDLSPIEDLAASRQESTVDGDRDQDHDPDDDDDQKQQQQQFRRIRSEPDSEARRRKKKVEAEAEAEVERVGMNKMKKSVSAMTSSSRRPAAAAALRREASVDEEVDAKADDFINRFRQQLKLQRLDSILRYKEMLTNSK